MPGTVISLFFSGLVFGSGPCLVSCGPMFLSYVVGTSKGLKLSLLSYLVFSLSRIFAYLIFAFVVYFLGSYFLENTLSNIHRYILISGGL